MVKHRKHRALATVVSTGILLSAVAILGSVLVSWSNSTFTAEQYEINKVYSDGVNKLNEYLVIENVWFGNNPSKFVNVTASNVGSVGLNVTRITLDNSIDRTDLLITDGGIVTNEEFSTEITYNWTSTDPIKITLTTEKGSIYQTFVLGP